MMLPVPLINHPKFQLHITLSSLCPPATLLRTQNRFIACPCLQKDLRACFQHFNNTLCPSDNSPDGSLVSMDRNEKISLLKFLHRTHVPRCTKRKVSPFNVVHTSSGMKEVIGKSYK